MTEPDEERPPASAGPQETRSSTEARLADAALLFSPGDVLAGRFRIQRFIARGGMGEVYEARDVELGEDVALKTVRPALAQDARSVERFKNEVHLARRVTHPSACRLFDVFHHPSAAGEVLFLTMELLRGETLAERLRRGRMSMLEALPVVEQMAAGLAAAHRAGVVHRDFKSGNVVLVPDPAEPSGFRAVVTDFGLARRDPSADASIASETVSGDVVGTPAYMAPEQVEGGPVTSASDVYALGVVMYEMLTGQRPFTGDNPTAAMVKRLKEAPASPRALCPELDPRWEAVVLRCLERDPGDRFHSAADVALALRGDTVVPGHRSRRARRRRLVGAALVGAALALAAGLFLLGRRQALREPAPRPSPTPAPQAAAVKPRRAVAVMGFKNASARADAAWISTALAEMLTSELAAGEALRTIPGESVARAKLELGLREMDTLARDTLARVRANLGSDLLVTGAYTALGEKSGGQIRLDLRLQDATTGETVATVTETGTEAGLFDLVSRAGSRMRGKLGLAERAVEAAAGVRAALPTDPAAARLYAEGLDRLRFFETLRARELLERAVAAEPSHPLSHAALAEAWSLLGYDARALAEASKAFDLASGLPQEHRLSVEARYREAGKEWDKAEEIYESLFRFFPDNVDYGIQLARVRQSGGKGKQALATLDALRLLPSPERDDPRIDLADAVASRYLSESKRAQAAAVRAVAKGRERGARLLVARARFEEGSALQNLGEFEAAREALEDARRTFAEAGDQKGVAGSLNNLSLMLGTRGDLAGARQLSEQALAAYRSIGNKSGEALIQGNLGTILYYAGDLRGARRAWQKTLVTYREINEKNGIARMLLNIASATAELGDPKGAVGGFEESLRVYREIGLKSGVASTLGDLSKTRLHAGDLAGAEKGYAEAQEIWREIGDKGYQMGSLQEYGDLLVAKGDLDAAHERYEAALALQEELKQPAGAEATRAALANVMLEEGRAAEAEGLARGAVEALAKEKAADAEGAAGAVLVRALLGLGRVEEAREAAGRAEAVAGKSQSRGLRLAIAIVAARARAASGSPGDLRAGEAILRGVAADTEKGGPYASWLEAGLALAEVEARAGRVGAARQRLGVLETEARGHGFGLAARRAEAALKALRGP